MLKWSKVIKRAPAIKMQLEWPEHSKKLVEEVNRLHFSAKAFHDVTLSAEGKHIKAHRVILASASTYFKELLMSTDDERFPIVFLKDVKHCDLQSIIDFIYTGKCEIEPVNQAACASLAETLGVSGFVNAAQVKVKSPLKRKSCDFKENVSPFVKWSASEPVSMPSSVANDNDTEMQLKRRKIHSLDNQGEKSFVTPPHPFNKASPPKPLMKSPAKNPHHTSHMSCPVESPQTSEASKLPHASMLNKISFDSTFSMMDQNELASRGASMLHHLAVWMMEEQRSSKANNDIHPPPAPPNSKSSSNQGSTNRRRAGESEGDRPDSGFDSKDEEESKLSVSMHHPNQVSETISEEAGIRTASSGDTSPDVTVEISRQAPIRQPIFRKRRLH